MSMFNPEYPPTFNSINGLLFAELPANCPAQYHGKNGYDFLSSLALTRSIQSNLAELELPAMGDGALRLAFFERLEAGNTKAISITEEMGQTLGLILLTLHNGTEKNRSANPAKDSAYWEYWAQVEQIYIAGGLTSGNAGQIIASEAQKLCPAIRVHTSDYPRHLPLLGAARYVPEGESALVFDFGGSFVKRAIAKYEDGLSGIEILEALPFDASGIPQVIFDSFVKILADSYRPVESSLIPVSIASYVDSTGQPCHNQHGVYMRMASLSDNLPALISQRLSQIIARDVQVKLLHDGTAAASFFSPLENAAVIMIGTAIGLGYPVPRPYLRPINPHNLRVINP
jgi:hypothetical protein